MVSAVRVLRVSRGAHCHVALLPSTRAAAPVPDVWKLRVGCPTYRHLVFREADSVTQRLAVLLGGELVHCGRSSMHGGVGQIGSAH